MSTNMRVCVRDTKEEEIGLVHTPWGHGCATVHALLCWTVRDPECSHLAPTHKADVYFDLRPGEGAL